MSAKIIDGKSIAAEVKADVAKKVSELKKSGVTPCLAVILVGNNPASEAMFQGRERPLPKPEWKIEA